MRDFVNAVAILSARFGGYDGFFCIKQKDVGNLAAR